MTSVRRTGAAHLRGGSMPASTSSDSALRRMRVARWSSRNRLARVSGSVSLVSSSVMKSSWRPRRFWLRRPRLTKLSAMLRRRTACSTARSRAVSCTVLRAVDDVGDLVAGVDHDGVDGGDRTSSPSGVSRMSMTASGSRRSAISLAWRVSDRNGLVIDRDTNHVSTTAVPSTTIASPANHSWRFRAASSQRVAAGVDLVGHRLLVGPVALLLGDVERAEQGVDRDGALVDGGVDRGDDVVGQLVGELRRRDVGVDAGGVAHGLGVADEGRFERRGLA